mgnify:CR=1 FL=1
MSSEYIPHKHKIFRDEIGQKATIQRTTLGEDQAAIPNRKLADLGLELNPVAQSLAYMGSAAMHVYWNETLKQVFFISQTQPLMLYKCPEILASKAFDDLLNTLKEQYNHRRPRLRSGF